MRIILIRHPETIANENGIMYGTTDYEYSKIGNFMFQEVLDNFIKEDPKAKRIYSSPRGRANKLAIEIARIIDSKVTVDELIREMEFGIFENLKPEEAKIKYPDFFSEFMEHYSGFKIPEGESFSDVLERARKFFIQIISLNEDCIVVSHGMFIKAAISYLLDLKLEESWHFNIKPGAIIEINYENNYGSISELKNVRGGAK
jgi:alpha-ribazole phosphatase